MAQGQPNRFSNFSNPTPPRSKGTSLSVLAIISLICGLIAAPLFCCIWVAAPMAIVAIITGHLAVSSINRSAGTSTGKPLAIIGLVVGYIALVVTVAAFIWALGHKPAPKSPEQESLDAAQLAIMTDNKGKGQGNNPEARELAEMFATAMEEIDKQVFTETKSKIKLSGGHYVTWCELHNGRCAFVVHVPEYRKFTDEAKKFLEELAWTGAQKVARKKLKPGDQVAIGLRGTLLYGAVMVGVITDNDPKAGLLERSTDAAKLLPFFKPDGAPQPAANDEVRQPPAPATRVEDKPSPPARVSSQPAPMPPKTVEGNNSPANATPAEPSSPAPRGPKVASDPPKIKAAPERPAAKKIPNQTPSTEDDLNEALADLKSGKESRSRAAANRLAKVSELSGPRDEIKQALLAMAVENDHFSQTAAIKALAVWGDSETANALADHLKSESDNAVRRETIETLGKLGGKDAIEALVGAMEKQSDRNEAVRALKEIGPDAEDAVIAILKGKNNNSRKAACDVLAEIGTNRCLSTLRAAAKDSELSVRSRAESALRKIEGRK